MVARFKSGIWSSKNCELVDVIACIGQNASYYIWCLLIPDEELDVDLALVVVSLMVLAALCVVGVSMSGINAEPIVRIAARSPLVLVSVLVVLFLL